MRWLIYGVAFILGVIWNIVIPMPGITGGIVTLGVILIGFTFLPPRARKRKRDYNFSSCDCHPDVRRDDHKAPLPEARIV